MVSRYVAVTGVCGWLLGALVVGAAAQASCADWNTEEFFEAASAEDVARCLGGGVDLMARDSLGGTPLHTAAAHSETPAVVEVLVDAGANVMARDLYGMTPLHRAGMWGQTLAVVNVLLEAGADPNAEAAQGATVLHLAAMADAASAAVIEALLEVGADAGAADEDGKTPWEYIDGSSSLHGTDVYWRLNEARFQ